MRDVIGKMLISVSIMDVKTFSLMEIRINLQPSTSHWFESDAIADEIF